jgi:hypothetical protein
MFGRVAYAGLTLLAVGCAGAALPQASFMSAPSAQPLPRVRSSAPVPAASADQFARIVLESHNVQRRAAGVPNLSWDAGLARGAADYARAIAQTGQLVHSPRASRPGIGENLWVGTAGAYRADEGVRSWASEKSDYRDGIFPNVSRTGDWLDVSHYTQMIWRTTTHVGCGAARSGRWDALVCRYSPKGNRDGQRPR